MNKEEIDKLVEEALEKEKSGRNSSKRSQAVSHRIAMIRRVLNAVFMLGFVAAIVIYFAMPSQRPLFYIVGFSSLAVKTAEYFLRFLF